MNKEFVASNGITLSFDDQGRFMYSEDGDEPRLVGMSADRWWGFTETSRNAAALAEYYRAKEDERLGRWRAEGYPDIYVRPMKGNPNVIGVVKDNEDGLAYGQFSRANHRLVYSVDPMSQVARAYFDAHPEPKPPWHEAKPGVWLLTFREGTLHEGAYVAGDWSFVAADHAVPKDDPRITSARKIWPQDEPAIDDLSYDA